MFKPRHKDECPRRQSKDSPCTCGADPQPAVHEVTLVPWPTPDPPPERKPVVHELTLAVTATPDVRLGDPPTPPADPAAAVKAADDHATWCPAHGWGKLACICGGRPLPYRPSPAGQAFAEAMLGPPAPPPAPDASRDPGREIREGGWRLDPADVGLIAPASGTETYGPTRPRTDGPSRLVCPQCSCDTFTVSRTDAGDVPYLRCATCGVATRFRAVYR